MAAAVRGVINGFSRIAETGMGGQGTVAEICVAAASTVLLGVAAGLFTLIAAGSVQWWAGRALEAPSQMPPTPTRHWVPATSLLLVLATAAGLLIGVRLLGLVGSTADRSMSDDAALESMMQVLGVQSVEELSAAFSVRLVVAFFSAAILSSVMIGVSPLAAVLVAMGRIRTTPLQGAVMLVVSGLLMVSIALPMLVWQGRWLAWI